jgi:predicted metal-dependent phosphoesterase TrpH
VRVVPAVEISSVDEGAPQRRELHILGYGIDHEGAALGRRLEEFLGDREQRTLRMAAAMRELGFDLDDRELRQRQAAGKPIGRPHVAAAVLGAAGNGQRLAREGIGDIGELIRAYLIEGKPAFRLRETPTVAQAIEAIHEAGGVAVWAHPFWDISEEHEVLDSIERFRALGIDGVEAFYITHSCEQTVLLSERCEQLGLLSTGSADFHGPENPQFSSFLAFDLCGREPRLGPIAE